MEAKLVKLKKIVKLVEKEQVPFVKLANSSWTLRFTCKANVSPFDASLLLDTHRELAAVEARPWLLKGSSLVMPGDFLQ